MKQTRGWVLTVLALSVLEPTRAYAQSVGDGILEADEIKLSPSGSTGTPYELEFGLSMDLDYNVLVVGAPEEDRPSMSAINAGAVYVYEYDGQSWNQTQRLVAPTTTFDDRFGSSVAVSLGSGDTDFIAVGSPWPDSMTGRVWIFKRVNDGDWEFERTLEQDDPQQDDQFGTDLDIDFFIPPNSQTGDPMFHLVVGAPRNTDDNGYPRKGSISIFQWLGVGAGWIEPAEFFGFNDDFVNADQNVQLGKSVALAGPLVVGGAWTFSPAGGQGTGAAFLYSQGNQQPGGGFSYSIAGRMQAATSVMFQRMGTAAAAAWPPIQAALGAEDNNENGTQSGAVYIFDILSHGLVRTEIQKLQASDAQAFDKFGTSLAMSGNVLAIGAPGAGDNGAIYIFEKGSAANSWTETGRILPDIAMVDGCRGGTGVGLSMTWAAAGCPPTGVPGLAMVYMGPVYSNDFRSGNLSGWAASVP